MARACRTGAADAGLGMLEEVIDLPGRLRSCVETRFRNGHHDRWREDDDSIVLYLYEVPIVFC
jgi:hypothetical protein